MNRFNNIKKIIILVILLIITLSTFSCNSILDRNKPAPQEKVNRTIDNALKWVDKHPANFTDGQFLEISESILMFYLLYTHNRIQPEGKSYYLEQIKRRLKLLASKPDYKIGHQEYTIFLAIASVMKKLDLDIIDYNKIIKETLLDDPDLYPSQHITTCIWNSLYLNRLGYKPNKSTKKFIEKSTLSKEIKFRLLTKETKNKANKAILEQIRLSMYDITHEIFCTTDFGEVTPESKILITQRDFFAELFEQCIKFCIKVKDVDLLSEIIMCSKILRLEQSIPSFHRAINFIISRQEEDGSFGITNPGRPNAFRHGVMVAVMGLCF